MFINFSNHPSTNWNKDQLQAAKAYGEIIDIPFPAIDPYASKDDITKLVSNYIIKIINNHPDAVMIQGEMCFTFQMIEQLKRSNIKCLCACSDRKTIESTDKQGRSVKTAIFEFIQFREY